MPIPPVVVNRGIELEVPEHHAVLIEHTHVLVGHQDEHASALVRSAESDVVQL